MSRLSDAVQSTHQDNNGKNTKAGFIKLAVEPAIIDVAEFTLPPILRENLFARYEAGLSLVTTGIVYPPPKA